nr:PIN domain-containing protein [Anabaena sphaerica]
MILYIETNFLMAIAKGQDSQAANLLYNPPQSVRIFIPNICYIEAVSTYRIEEKYGLHFQEEMGKKIRELGRDKSSNYAQSFLRSLEQARIDNMSLMNDIKSRLLDAIDKINTNAQIIHVSDYTLHNICQAFLTEMEVLLIKNDIMDNLILQCILEQANLHPEEEKAFISNNTKDFNEPEVKDALRSAGIRYFTMTQHFLDWFNSSESN